ncbi:hypothetical protein EV386_2562 [Xylanimonas ulmi]|uniref:Uncharacterized protein n=1 Tax=Xylanimonas ulmi TaxID=228973 RepID=A0A4Q7M5H9_9MICO|nr:hypothetical protein EV386_2562 [Xylanibacterium ulmi]
MREDVTVPSMVTTRTAYGYVGRAVIVGVCARSVPRVHRRSNVSASTASRSERLCNVCNTITAVGGQCEPLLELAKERSTTLRPL